MVDFLVGGEAGSNPEPDIPSLGIEVKTIPIGRGARVLQPTKVTMINYGDLFDTGWWESGAFHKLRSVLFVPIVKFDPSRPDQWFIRRPFLWLPNETELSRLKADYDEVREIVKLKEFHRISSANPPKGQGLALHPKPSAANSKIRRTYHVGDTTVALLPRAWMLRPAFTQSLVTHNLKLDLESA